MLTVGVANRSAKEILWRGMVKDALADRSDKNIKKYYPARHQRLEPSAIGPE